MAFWKLKLFKNGSSSSQQKNHYNDYGHHLKEEINDEKTDYIFKREDSPKMDSISSLEEAYANLPLVKSKPDVTKRQLSSKNVSKLNQPPRQSLTMEEALRQQEIKSTETMVPPSDDSMENNSATPIAAWHPTNDKPPNLPSPDDHLLPVGLPSWRNEKLTDAKQPASQLASNHNSNNSSLPDPNGKPSSLQYSPSLSSSERSRILQDAKPSSDQYCKGKNLHISSVTIPQPQPSTPCFVVNSPCMFTGSYPCYVMNVMHSTPYVPVQIYPMMLVPNQQLPNRVDHKMVY